MDKKLQKNLQSLRKRIDSADRALLKAFGTRFKAVNQVGAVKRKHGLPIVQRARWAEVVEDRVKIAAKNGLNEGFTRSLLKLIHQEAVRIQKRKHK